MGSRGGGLALHNEEEGVVVVVYLVRYNVVVRSGAKGGEKRRGC